MEEFTPIYNPQIELPRKQQVEFSPEPIHPKLSEREPTFSALRRFFDLKLKAARLTKIEYTTNELLKLMIKPDSSTEFSRKSAFLLDYAIKTGLQIDIGFLVEIRTALEQLESSVQSKSRTSLSITEGEEAQLKEALKNTYS